MQVTEKPPRIAIEFRTPENLRLYRRIEEIAREERRSLAQLLRVWAEEKVAERERRAEP